MNKTAGTGKKELTVYKIPIFRKIGIFLLVLSSLLSSIRLFVQTVNFRRVVLGNDYISRYENRFSELKQMLYHEESIGYLSDVIPRVNSDETTADYILTQYAMTPIVVDKEKKDGFIIGNFRSKRSVGNANKGKRVLIRDFGNGLVLFKGTGESK